MDKAGPMAVNGMPMFLSFRLVSIDDTKKVLERYNKIKEAVTNALSVLIETMDRIRAERKRLRSFPNFEEEEKEEDKDKNDNSGYNRCNP